MTHLFLTTLVCILSASDIQLHTLKVEDDIWDITAQDITGNGSTDLLLLTCDRDSDPLRKQLHLFQGNSAGQFNATADFTLHLTPEASALFLVQLDENTPHAVLAGDNLGFQMYQFDVDSLVEKDYLPIESIIPANAREPVFLTDNVRDWTGDGQEEWLLPQANGYSLHRKTEQAGFITCEVISQIRQSGHTTIYHRLPDYVLFDIPETPNPALAFILSEEIEFAYGVDWKQRHRIRIPGNHREHYRSFTSLKDINNNGLPDLIVTEMKGTVSMESTTNIYLAQEPFVYLATPSTSIYSRGAVAAPYFHDLDGNGTLDALVVSMSFGPRNIMNYFFRKRVSVDVETYRFKDNRFEDRPAHSISLSMDAPEGRGRVAYTMGDFNGDGHLDVAYALSADTLAIHLGEADGIISNRPWKTVTLPTTMGDVYTYDLTGNGGEDIVLFHPDSTYSKQVHVITFGSSG